MNTFETICSRKSVRSYTGEKVSDEELKKLLTAANAAPVGMKAYDSLVLSVITNRALLDKIDKNGRKFLNMPDIAMLYGAPTLILVSSKMADIPNDNNAYSNAAIIAHNMALEAVELGLGACCIWGAVFAMNQSEEILQELKLPEGYVPCCAISVGKTEEKYEMRDIPENRIKVIFNE